MKKFRKVLLLLGILVGFALLSYPFISQLYYDQEATTEVEDFEQALAAIDPPELKEENVKIAEAYNEALEPNLSWVDPYSEEEREEGVEIYAQMLEVQEKMGIVNIPKINVRLPLYVGTDDSILQNGVGHLEGTSLPVGGEHTHSVVTAHRGLPEARLFTDLDQMEIGDVFSLETMADELFYEVDQMIVVEPDETDEIMIEPGEDFLTLLTCTPYMINSHRLLVRGRRVPAPPKEVIDAAKETQEKDIGYYLTTYWYYFLIIIGALLVVGLVTWFQNSDNEEFNKQI